ncbi:MAG TPA: PQ-loop domain-containing transporter [Acidothermaceae bacterium]|nr:PQ-loop domain-containing transporter [Acidothermaceae bacterium]
MSGHDVAVGLGYLGATLGVFMVVPQIARIIRHPSLTGVSPLSWACTAYACTAWLTYGLRTGATPQIPGNVLLASGAVVCVLLINSTTSRGRRGALLLVGAAVLLVTVWVIPPDSVGYLATVIGLGGMAPQLFDTFGNWRRHITSAVSLPTYALRGASQVAWLGYAFGTHDLPVGVGASLCLTIVAVTFGLEALARTSRPAYARLATAEA